MMSATRFQEFAARFLKKNPQLAGTWVQNNFKHAGRVFFDMCTAYFQNVGHIYIYNVNAIPARLNQIVVVSFTGLCKAILGAPLTSGGYWSWSRALLSCVPCLWSCPDMMMVMMMHLLRLISLTAQI